MIEEGTKASPELRVHFEKLIALKNKVSFYKHRDRLLEEIYEDLNGIIKEVQE